MKETAEYLGISYWLVNQLVRRKQIPCARVGGRVLFRVKALDEYRIKNWDKYQSADKYELVKEQNRERQKRFRENKEK